MRIQEAPREVRELMEKIEKLTPEQRTLIRQVVEQFLGDNSIKDKQETFTAAWFIFYIVSKFLKSNTSSSSIVRSISLRFGSECSSSLENR